jgi:hypothetical protein
MNTTTIDRSVRMRQLDEEIGALRGKIARSFQDESLLLRTVGPGCEVDIIILSEERHRNEAALYNLEKEGRELNAEAAFTKTA